ncbi:exonuclease subunit SbcD [Prochlorothrix hollandica]|uniref:exonuclease subunit SbcD n=1 Tax=Prochlorothrix hollandica TaxID=1223 RepID=UPI00333FF7FF
MVKILHLSDIHLGSGFSHGHINPQTGLNTRLEDFGESLRLTLDRAIAEDVDLVLFGGDAFPDATPPPYVQETFAAQFRRLVDADIPTVLLVGNHDQHTQGQGGASLCIYRTLGVPGFIVGDRLETHRITTRSGPVQVTTLPWLTHSTLLTRPEMDGLSLGEVNQHLLDRLAIILEGEIRQLDPQIPAVLLAHAMLDTARYGAERYLAVGKGFTLPLSLVTRSAFNYVALGHVHRHQVLCTHPPVVYAGSLDRVDFSEEKEEKGYVLITIGSDTTDYEFCPLPVRPFKTLRLDLSDNPHPQAALLKALAKADLQDAIVRLIYTIKASQLAAIDLHPLREALAPAHSYTIQPELATPPTPRRLPELGEGQDLSPLDALQAYVDNRSDLEDLAESMIQAAQLLWHGEDPEAEGARQRSPGQTARTLAQEPGTPYHTDEKTQLRLL